MLFSPRVCVCVSCEMFASAILRMLDALVCSGSRFTKCRFQMPESPIILFMIIACVLLRDDKKDTNDEEFCDLRCRINNFFA